MKKPALYLSVLFLLATPSWCGAQKNPYWQEPGMAQADSLKRLLATQDNDTVRMYINRQLGLYYQEINRTTALAYYEEQLQIAKALKQKIWEAEALSRIGYVSSLLQNYSGALKSLLQARDIASDPHASKGLLNASLFSKKGDASHGRMTLLASINQHLGILYYFTGDFPKALEYYEEVKRINEIVHDNALMSLTYLSIGEAYVGVRQLDSAKLAFNQALLYCAESGHNKYKGLIYYDMGKIFETQKDYPQAKEHFGLCVQTSIAVESPDFLGMGYVALANITKLTGDFDSSLLFSRNALATYLTMNDSLGLISANLALSSAFDAIHQTDSAYYYLKRGIALNAMLNKEERVKKFQVIGFSEQLKLRALEADQLRLQSKVRTYTLVAGIGILLLISSVFYRSNRRQRKDKAKIEKAYARLEATQSQLIQSEKMASLGELTAGIAHEIQNPLNFVNNFSEVNKELLSEMKEEIEKRNYEEVKAIANDVIDNQEKINHHGKRADAIVKGMLQHSRTSTGQKELTDINALADEYLRLAYHGLRAKDKSFNAVLKTDFDKSIGNVNIIPQDIGRVVLNLINNAFYAVDEKKKSSLAEASADKYEPAVSVSTKREKGKVEIKVKDNGNGIPQKILDKIFQPFFTTKPTGQGTGLGLSMSYDIVKAHGGEIKVETKENEGTEFTIVLPAG